MLTARHDAVCRHGIAPMCRAARHVVTVETRGGYGAEPNRAANVTGAMSRPDVSVLEFPYGALETAVDATFSSPLCPSFIGVASRGHGRLRRSAPGGG